MYQEGSTTHGGSWVIAAGDSDTAKLWQVQWQRMRTKPGETRLWNVRGEPVTTGQKPVFPAIYTAERLNALSRLLLEALTDIRHFALIHELGDFPRVFLAAANTLRSQDPERLSPYPDLAPQGLLSLQARQLLAACQIAFVFAGRQCWTGYRFSGRQAYDFEQLSIRLYQLANEGFQAVANSQLLPEL